MPLSLARKRSKALLVMLADYCPHRAQQWLHTQYYLLQARAGKKCKGWRLLIRSSQISLSPSTLVSPHSSPPSSPPYSPLSSHPALLHPSTFPVFFSLLPSFLLVLPPFLIPCILTSSPFVPFPSLFLPVPFFRILTPTLPVLSLFSYCHTIPHYSSPSLLSFLLPPSLLLSSFSPTSSFCSSFFPAILHSI